MNQTELERFNLQNYHLVSHYSRKTTTGGGGANSEQGEFEGETNGFTSY